MDTVNKVRELEKRAKTAIGQRQSAEAQMARSSSFLRQSADNVARLGGDVIGKAAGGLPRLDELKTANSAYGGHMAYQRGELAAVSKAEADFIAADRQLASVRAEIRRFVREEPSAGVYLDKYLRD
jgi:hypothetical protein